MIKQCLWLLLLLLLHCCCFFCSGSNKSSQSRRWCSLWLLNIPNMSPTCHCCVNRSTTPNRNPNNRRRKFICNIKLLLRLLFRLWLLFHWYIVKLLL
uniref:Candidate secreted effector n=1 Tax=Meloidogyne incognita TaxID=6306 RepID=A0A914NED0_MELIC